MSDQSSIIIIGGDGNENFEKSIRRGVYLGCEESEAISRVINIDLAPFVPYTRNRYNVPSDLIRQILSAVKNANRGVVFLPGSIMPVADENTVKEVLQLLETESPRTACIGMQHKQMTTVASDDYQGISAMINHLIHDHGYKKIAYVSGPQGYEDAEQRNRAYSETMKKENLKTFIENGDFSPDGGVQAVKSLRKQGVLESIDAIICADDDTASGVIAELTHMGFHIPEDIAVTGFDNSPHSELLGMTSVDPLIENQGRTAVANLLSGRQSAVIETSLKKRRSCGCSPITASELKISPVKHESASEESEEISAKPVFPFLKSRSRSKAAETTEDQLLNRDLLVNLVKSELKDNEPAESIADYFFKKEYDLEKLSGMMFSLFPRADDPYALIKKMRQVLDSIVVKLLTEFPNDQNSLVKVINIYQILPELHSKYRESEKAQNKISSEQLTETLLDIKSEIVSSYDIRELIDAVNNGISELELKDFCLLLFESDHEYFSYSDKVEKQLKPYIKRISNIHLSEEIQNGDSENILQTIVESIRDHKVSIVPLYYEKTYGYLVFGDISPVIIQSLQESISLALDKIRGTEEKNVKNLDLQKNRDRIINLVEPLIQMAQTLADYVINNKKSLIGNLNTSAETSIDRISKSGKAVDYINKQLTSIVDLIKSIDDITERTEVLSINASIEAARAGDAGRGFSVIANGIKKLSEAQSAESTRVNEHIKDAEKAMRNAVIAGDENKSAVENVRAEITQTIGFFDQIEQNLERIIFSGNEILQEIKAQKNHLH